MAFSQADITSFRLFRRGAELVAVWTSDAPAGTTYQVYVAGRLAWSGTATSATIPAPAARSSVIVGAVDADEAATDLSGTPEFPADAIADRVRLTWVDGGAAGETTAFAIYGEAEPGGGIDYGTPLAIVPAAPTIGGGSYTWTSTPGGTGLWHFGIKARDAAGVESTAVEVAVALTVPPRPPAATADGTRLSVSDYDSGTGVATLAWLASPASPAPGG